MTSCSYMYILYLYNVHHCTNSAAFSDVVYKHDNTLYPGPQPIPPAPFDPDHMCITCTCTLRYVLQRWNMLLCNTEHSGPASQANISSITQDL